MQTCRRPVMRHSLFFLLLLLIPSTIYAQSVTSEELEQRDNLWYLSGSDTPFTGELRDEGVREGKIENGQRVGRWTTWHENGNISSESDFVASAMTYHAMYFPNGAMRFKGTYSDGRLDGPVSLWHPSGTPQSETEFAMGQRHGKRILWDLEGNVLYSAFYTAGQLDGPAIWWYDNGQKRWATYHKKGQKWGVWTQWTRDGRIIGQSDWEDGIMVARQSQRHR